MGKMDGYRDMAMYLSVMYQAACYDADGVLEDGGGGRIFVLVRRVGCSGRLPAPRSVQVAAPRSAGSYSRPVQIDGDAVSMTEPGYPKLQGLGRGRRKVDRVCVMKLWSQAPKQDSSKTLAVNSFPLAGNGKPNLPSAFPSSLLSRSPSVSLSKLPRQHGSHSAHRRGPKRRPKLRASLETRSVSVLFTQRAHGTAQACGRGVPRKYMVS